MTKRSGKKRHIVKKRRFPEAIPPPVARDFQGFNSQLEI
jgi:hypothetical protein